MLLQSSKILEIENSQQNVALNTSQLVTNSELSSLIQIRHIRLSAYNLCYTYEISWIFMLNYSLIISHDCASNAVESRRKKGRTNYFAHRQQWKKNNHHISSNYFIQAYAYIHATQFSVHGLCVNHRQSHCEIYFQSAFRFRRVTRLDYTRESSFKGHCPFIYIK